MAKIYMREKGQKSKKTKPMFANVWRWYFYMAALLVVIETFYIVAQSISH